MMLERLAADLLTCVTEDLGSYGRLIGDCHTNDVPSLAEAMVKSGWAIAWVERSGARFADAEVLAQRQSLGVWSRPECLAELADKHPRLRR